MDLSRSITARSLKGCTQLKIWRLNVVAPLNETIVRKKKKFDNISTKLPVSRLLVGETCISGFVLDSSDAFPANGPEMSAAGSLFPAARALAQRWYSASYCSISSLEMRYFENSPSSCQCYITFYIRFVSNLHMFVIS